MTALYFWFYSILKYFELSELLFLYLHFDVKLRQCIYFSCFPVPDAYCSNFERFPIVLATSFYCLDATGIKKRPT